MRLLCRSLLLAAIAVVTTATKQGQHSTNKTFPRCDSPIYCEGPLLKTVQLAKLYPDSKTFVDKVCVEGKRERERASKKEYENKENKQYADLVIGASLPPLVFSL